MSHRSSKLQNTRDPVSRRELLEWLGAGTTLALSGPTLASILAACDGANAPSTAAVDASARPADAGGDAPWANDAPSSAPESGARGFAFEPAPPEGHPVFDGWGERTVDTQDLQRILQSWRLTVEGMVSSPLSLSFADLLALPRTDMIADFHCVEGWSIHDVPYTGVTLASLLQLATPTAAATHLTIHSVASETVTYLESIPIAIAREPKTLLAYGIAGATIPLKHGFPLRLVIPRLLAYKSSKFVDRIVLEDQPREGFWVARGYSYEAEVPEERLREGKY